MNIILAPRAEKELRHLNKTDQIVIANKIRSLSKDQPISHVEKLAGYTDIFRVRVGHFRIVYKKNQHQLYIILIAHRKDVYSLLKRLF